MTLEDPPEGRLRVSDTPFSLRDLDYPRDRPEVGREPVRECPLREQVWELRQLFPWNQRRPSRSGKGPEGGGTAPIECVLPVTDGHLGDSEAASDFGLREPGPEEGEPIQSAFFEGSGVTVELSPASHARGESTPRIITYLRKSQ